MANFDADNGQSRMSQPLSRVLLNSAHLRKFDETVALSVTGVVLPARILITRSRHATLVRAAVRWKSGDRMPGHSHPRTKSLMVPTGPNLGEQQ
jgi:hypothetical protein